MRLADWGGGGVGAADAELYGDFHAYIVQFVRALFMNPEEEGVCDYDKILAHSRTPRIVAAGSACSLCADQWTSRDWTLDSNATFALFRWADGRAAERRDARAAT